MDRSSVKSSQIESVGYDPESKKLHVEFKGKNGNNGNSVYEYDDVEPEAHAALMGAESHGRHFGQQIRGKYAYRKLQG